VILDPPARLPLASARVEGRTGFRLLILDWGLGKAMNKKAVAVLEAILILSKLKY